ncbi:MAG: hypothetical protein LBL81_02055, partial [Tannerella sp.]|nr:hypothetical protein [Tannerella sp.]
MQPISDKLAFPTVEPEVNFEPKKAFPLLQTSFFGKLKKSLPPAYSIFVKMDALLRSQKRGAVDDLPLWEDFYKEEIKNFPTLLQLLFLLSTNWEESRHSLTAPEYINRAFNPGIRRFFGFDLSGLKPALLKLPHFTELVRITYRLGKSHWDAAYANRLAANLLASALPLMKKEQSKQVYKPQGSEGLSVYFFQHSAISYWMGKPFREKADDKAFAVQFYLVYAFYQAAHYLQPQPAVALSKPLLSLADFSRAYALGLVPESEVEAELTTRLHAKEFFRQAAGQLAGAPDAPLSGLIRRLVAEVVEKELRRGKKNTLTTPLALQIEHLEGAALWIRIQESFGA